MPPCTPATPQSPSQPSGALGLYRSDTCDERSRSPISRAAPIPQAVREFLTRVIVVDQARDSSAILVQALEASLDPAVVPLLIDIDALREGGMSPQDPEMPRFFDQLRQLKNEIFFASVTERTVEMCA